VGTTGARLPNTIPHVTRGVFAATLGLLALVVALPAGADNGRSARGSIVSITPRAISVKTGDAKVTCALADRSPSLSGYAAGDRVAIACHKVRHFFVLARIRHLAAETSSEGEAKKVTFAGAITVLSATSISLHDGDRDLTCTLTDASPSTAELKIGVHVRVACTNGVLTALAPVTPPPATRPAEPPRQPEPTHPTTHVLTGAIGTITVLEASTVTVHNAEHDLTCSTGDSSPHLGDYHVGDRVKVLCTDGVLTTISRPE
jgi:hypothetical protein